MLAVQALNGQSYAPFMAITGRLLDVAGETVLPGQFAISGVG
jgi:hypothetical protein